MNRFRTKRRAKDDSSAGRSSEESEHSSMPFKSFRKGKKVQQEEVKKEFDLTTALPSTDDFRTSLLMSNLSARFSMLREQDDPNTKIGKASDDSVLYPKRQSRMADFGYGGGLRGLADIAEVESIKAPFARTDSYASDDADSTKGGSIMNRGKPTEGNVLFGGRQKIYKIPAGAKSSSGGMGGRALYDDDVALSAFQRWRQTERENQSLEFNDDAGENEDQAEPARSESPPLSFNRRRETSSTTSSASFMARNSTAATSVNSQATAGPTDVLPSTSTVTSPTPAPERLVTRTRRLYEQALTQDMQDQQNSALSRIDTLTRPRHFGARTPDNRANSPSPTTAGFPDRLFGERRTVLTKASAPNLRTPLGPAMTGPSTSAIDLGIKVPAQTETKLNIGGAPPLSPPISETGDQPVLPIQPNDVGKATAMGMFQKPSQPYDESKYAQRMIQLQQGREGPVIQKSRTESGSSFDTARSRSSSSAQRHILDTKSELIRPQPAVLEEGLPPTPANTDPETSPSVSINAVTSLPTLDIDVARPADTEHPAFRQSAMPPALSVVDSKPESKPSPTAEPQPTAPETADDYDSPTLGPVMSGLSGMVRQHLRSDSTSSSIYGAPPQTSGLESRFHLDLEERSAMEGMGAKSNPWLSSGTDWTVSYYGNSVKPPSEKPQQPPTQPKLEAVSDSKPSDRASNLIPEDEDDEFATQLADARRRVREKLTSYVESDSSRAGSPLLQPTDTVKELTPVSSSVSLGLGLLKSKTSRGSLADRSRNAPINQSKTVKKLGLGAVTMSAASPQPSKESLTDKESTPLEAPIAEKVNPEAVESSVLPRQVETETENKTARDKDEDESNAHPGLRQFRQARRELQRRKELETLARHQASQTSQPASRGPNQEPTAQLPPRTDSRLRQRTPSRERKPPPGPLRSRAPSDDYNFSSPPERERSGSDTSGDRPVAHARPPRIRTNTGPYEEQLAPANQRPMMRSPGLPGKDVKNSPIMPPHGYSRGGAPSPAPSPRPFERSRTGGNLALHIGRPGYDFGPGQPSPISPMGLPSPSPFNQGSTASPVGTPTTLGPRPRQASASQSPSLGPMGAGSMKRMVDKREISEPTFVMSTSRVPTMNLPYSQQGTSPDMNNSGRPHEEPRSRADNGGRGPAPPVPPINPRRRREDPSRTRGGYEDVGMAPPRPMYASQTNSSTASLDYEENRSAFSVSDDEGSGKPDQRRRLRKANPDMAPPGSRPAPGGRARDNSPPFVARGPPASRTMAATGASSNAGMGIPGGMI